MLALIGARPASSRETGVVVKIQSSWRIFIDKFERAVLGKSKIQNPRTGSVEYS